MWKAVRSQEGGKTVGVEGVEAERGERRLVGRRKEGRGLWFRSGGIDHNALRVMCTREAVTKHTGISQRNLRQAPREVERRTVRQHKQDRGKGDRLNFAREVTCAGPKKKRSSTTPRPFNEECVGEVCVPDGWGSGVRVRRDRATSQQTFFLSKNNKPVCYK
jgi:hypothetical protein